jgi:hypothetical protein
VDPTESCWKLPPPKVAMFAEMMLRGEFQSPGVPSEPSAMYGKGIMVIWLSTGS